MYLEDISVAEISTDRRFLVCGGATGKLHAYDLMNKKKLSTFDDKPQVSGKIEYLDFSPDNQYIVSVHLMSGRREISLWEFKTGKLLKTISNISQRITAISISPDNKYIVYSRIRNNSSNYELAWMQVEEPFTEEIHPYPNRYIDEIIFTNREKLLVLGYKQRETIISTFYKGKNEFKFDVYRQAEQQIKRFCLADDENSIALVAQIKKKGRVSILDLNSFNIISSFTLDEFPTACSINAESKLFAAANYKQEISVYNLSNGDRLKYLESKTREVNDILISPNDQFIAHELEQNIYLLDLHN